MLDNCEKIYRDVSFRPIQHVFDHFEVFKSSFLTIILNEVLLNSCCCCFCTVFVILEPVREIVTADCKIDPVIENG